MKDEPRRKRLRLREYDYAAPGPYFVTICTRDRHFVFGNVIGQEMKLNALGRIAEE